MIIEVLQSSLFVTSFVFVMMIAVEYLNVLTRGGMMRLLQRKPSAQVGLAAGLGVIPGCLGSFATVSMYIHRLLSFGALCATMIATSGDEAFIMLALFPEQAWLLFAILFGSALISGIVINLIVHRKKPEEAPCPLLHKEEPDCWPKSWRMFSQQWRKSTAIRRWLTLTLVLFCWGAVSNNLGHQHVANLGLDAGAESCAHDHHGHDHDHATPEPLDADHDAHAAKEAGCDGHGNWFKFTLLGVGLFALFVVVTTPDHFLEAHVWEHLVRRHIGEIFGWTFGALLVTHWLTEWLPIHQFASQNPLILLLIACLIGIIPQSGPNLIIVSLFAQGAIPFYILLANCMVQDGHGSLPLLAHSRRDFIKLKGISFSIAMTVGLVLHFFLR